MSWEKRVLPVFMSISSGNLRKVLHPIQIDTTHFRFKRRRNPGSQSQDRSVNRTAVFHSTNPPLFDISDELTQFGDHGEFNDAGFM